ncbi:hypothetical protein B296_00024169 [Ensete ventricosum]|uniref:Uncharacterized protein n=1 Tax=Ensete ventricosum TaxID=4639 RepID=A0A426ZLK9_ENSVE|nr:hypothetical protein B296_00024169 [Ensete ventricosum]
MSRSGKRKRDDGEEADMEAIAKKRWAGKTIVDLFADEFKGRSYDYYVRVTLPFFLLRAFPVLVLFSVAFGSGKAPYRPVHTGLAVDRYAYRSLLGGTAKIGHQRSNSAVDGRLKKKKGKEEEEKKKEEVPGRCPHLRALAARGSTASRRRPWATIVTAWGDKMSPRAGRRNISSRWEKAIYFLF